MTVGIKIKNTITEIGTGAFLHAFFSTVSYHLEPKGWGSVYPVTMKKLYQGQLESEDANEASREMKEIQKKLARFTPNQVVWDIEDMKKKPPWGDNVSDHIMSLANYFVTSTGRDLIGALIEDLEYLGRKGGTLTIIQYQGYPVGDQIKWIPE